MDPFDRPEAPDAAPPSGTLDLGDAVQQGFSATVRNLLPAVVGGVLALLAYVASACTLVGWIVVVPLLFWGLQVFRLNAIDGVGTIEDWFSGRRDLGRAFAQGWLYFVVFLLPLTVINLTPTAWWNYSQAGSVIPLEPVSPVVPTIVTAVLGLLVGVVTCRLMLADLFLVDHRKNAIDALVASWEATSGSWTRMYGLLVVGLVVNWPGTVLIIGAQLAQARVAAGELAPSMGLFSLVAQLAGTAWLAGSSLLVMMFWTAAYRQLVPRSESAPAEG